MSDKEKGSGSEPEHDSDIGPDDPKFFKNASIDAVLDHLQATRKGLSTSEVDDRLAQYGENKLPEHHVHPVLQFLLFYWNPLSWTMEFAAFLSIVLGDYVDFLLISGLLTVNAIIGFYEEHSAGNAMEALKSQLAPTAMCLRDGEWKETAAFGLVPGDIIRLTLGNVVPADVKLLEADKGSKQMKIDQSSLTGESLPVTKYPGSELFAGSSVKMGEMDAVVYATGVNTFFGKAANLVATTESHGHFQEVLKNIGLFCIVLIVGCVALELFIQFPFRQKPCSGLTWQPGKGCPTLDNILVLIVGGIPIAMPTVLSVTMAMGAAKLAKHQAIVARLTAVEELAGMDVLCSDKTGTLTLNQLRVDTPVLASDDLNIDPEVVHLHSALAAALINPDAIDFAMVESLGDKKKLLTEEYEQLKFTPFDPVSKKSQAVVKRLSDGHIFKVCKGAPQVMLRHVANQKEVEDKVNHLINEFAERGYRALGVAYCENPKDTEGDEEETEWIYEGVIPMFDPPRIDTKEVIEKVRDYGIMVKMITGDQMAIARETCKQLGMGEDPTNPNILTPDHLDQAEKEGNPHLVETADGFAQVFPEHKFAIVAGLQKLNHVVGMTGDGVNDAPALKKADIGIAVADATDAARAASDIVLVSPGLSVIVEAIFGSRKIFQRMRNYVLYSVSSTVRVCFTFMLLTLIFDFYFPTVVIAIMALLNDGTILTISKDRVRPSKTPDHWYLPRVFIFALVLGGFLVLETIVLFLIVYLSSWPQDWFTMNSLNNAQLRGLIYINISISGQATIFSTRTEGWWFMSRPSILLLGAFIIAQVVATLIGLYGFNGYPSDDEADFEGCGWAYALLGWIWTFFWFLLMDPIKFVVYILIDLFVRAHPVRRTKKVFGHPVYGRHGRKTLHFGTMWPQMAMEPPSPEDVAEVAAGLRRASLDLVERPWAAEADGVPLAERKKKHKKHKKDPARSKLVSEESSDDEAFKHHHHHHHRHKDSSDSDEYGSDLSYEEYTDDEKGKQH